MKFPFGTVALNLCNILFRRSCFPIYLNLTLMYENILPKNMITFISKRPLSQRLCGQ